MRKAAAAVAAEDSGRIKMVARHLLVWLPNCSCTRSAQSKGGLTLPCMQAGGWGRMKGATAFLLLSAMSNHLEAHVWDGTGEGERNVPSPLEPRVAICPLHPVAMLLNRRTVSPQPLTPQDAPFPPTAPGGSAISLVQSRGIIHISDKRIGY